MLYIPAKKAPVNRTNTRKIPEQATAPMPPTAMSLASTSDQEERKEDGTSASTTTQTWMSVYLQYTFYEEIPDPEFLINRAISKKTCETVAIKIIDKNKEDENFIQQIRNEIEIMWHLDHQNILNLLEIHDEPENLFLVYEYFSGEKLHHRIMEEGPFTEPYSARIIMQILQGVRHMHDAGVCHRDLKPENILIEGDVVKIAEFSLSRNYKTFMKTSCGTPEYVAPEILSGKQYTASVDIWSVGVITYVLLCNFPPFYGNTDQEIFEKILRAHYEFPSPDWDSISEEAVDFISNILMLDYFSRPSAGDCLESPWIRDQALLSR